MLSIKFLNRVIPKENESLYSFLFRTVRANYYSSLFEVFREIKSFHRMQCNELVDGAEWISIAKEIVESQNLDINRLVCNQWDTSFYKFDEKKEARDKFPFDVFYLKSFTKYCPNCLNEDFYHRLHWDITFVSICPKHNTQLIMNCPRCNRYITSYSLLRDYCTCGIIWSNVMPQKVTDPSILCSQSVFHSALLEENIEIERSDGQTLKGKEYLRYFSIFHLFLRLFKTEEFDRSKIYPQFHRFLYRFYEMKGCELEYINFSVPLIHDLITNPEKEASKVFGVWEQHKFEQAKKLRSEKTSVLFEMLEMDKSAPYTESYRNYLRMTESVYQKRPTVSLDLSERNYVGITDASILIERSATFIKTLCKHNFVNNKTIRVGNEEVLIVDAKSLLRLTKRFEKLLRSKSAAEYLGIRYKQFQTLMDNKLIKVVHGPLVDGYPSSLVAKKQVYDLEDSIRCKCQEISVVDNEWVKYDYAIRYSGKEYISYGELLQLVLSGKVRGACLIGEPVLKGLHFLKEDVHLVRRESFKKCAEKRGYSKRELGKILKIGSEKVNELISEGTIKVNSNKGNYLYFNKRQVIEKLIEIKNYNEEEAIKYLDKMEIEFAMRSIK